MQHCIFRVLSFSVLMTVLDMLELLLFPCYRQANWAQGSELARDGAAGKGPRRHRTRGWPVPCPGGTLPLSAGGLCVPFDLNTFFIPIG